MSKAARASIRLAVAVAVLRNEGRNHDDAMTFLLLSALAFLAIGAVITFRAVRSAPEGFEDETGFHVVRSAAALPAATRTEDSQHLHGNHLAGGLA